MYLKQVILYSSAVHYISLWACISRSWASFVNDHQQWDSQMIFDILQHRYFESASCQNSFLILSSSCRVVAHFGFGSSFNWRLPERQGRVALYRQFLCRLPPLQQSGLFIAELGTATHTHTHTANQLRLETIWEVLLFPSLPSGADAWAAYVYKVNARACFFVVGRRVGTAREFNIQPSYDRDWLMELNCGICQSKICRSAIETGLNEWVRPKRRTSQT